MYTPSGNHFLFTLPLLLLSNLIHKPMPAQSISTQILFDFQTEATSGRWLPVNDTVMGGVSNSSFGVTPDGIGQFTGSVSLENNGGFASVRTIVEPAYFEGFTGINIRVRGDGNSYSLRFRTNRQLDGISFRYDFDTKKDEWIELAVPFEKFTPTFRGRKLRNVGPLEPSAINQMGFLISDKQTGPFTLDIDWIACYK